MSTPHVEQLTALASRGRAMALDVLRFQRQEESQGQVSPMDAAFLGRLRNFLDQEVGQGLEDLVKEIQQKV